MYNKIPANSAFSAHSSEADNIFYFGGTSVGVRNYYYSFYILELDTGARRKLLLGLG